MNEQMFETSLEYFLLFCKLNCSNSSRKITHNIVKSRKSALKNESLVEKSDGSLSGVN